MSTPLSRQMDQMAEAQEWKERAEAAEAKLVEAPRCRHNRAWPTLWGNASGLMWCPDCGARRDIVCNAEGTSFRMVGPWIYPRGAADVLRQLEWKR